MSLLRATAMLGAGNALAHALPLLLGPWIARLYSPAEFAAYALWWAVASNLAVVACMRYEMALPLARGAQQARALLAVCLRLLAAWWLGLSLAVLAAWLWRAAQGLPLAPDASLWLALPLLVVLMGGVQLLGLWATRQQAFGALAWSRLAQWGGAAVLQVALGLWALGAWGLWGGAVLGLLLALLLLLRAAGAGGRWRFRGVWCVGPARRRAVARRFRDFPWLNTPHAFAGAAQETVALLLIAACAGDPAAGLWAFALRYLRAPATLVGSALSSTLYPQLAQAPSFEAARQQVRRSMLGLALLALPGAAVLLAWGPGLFAWAFGEPWREAGELARALVPYLVLHFVASPLSVVTLAWRAQAWALKLALVGQVLFLAALALGLNWGLVGAGWAVSGAMLGYFAYYFVALWRWTPQP